MADQPCAERRHGTDLELRCRQCSATWPFGPDAPTQCPDCTEHLGELIDPEHPDWCMRDRGCSLPAGHDGACDLTAGITWCRRNQLCSLDDGHPGRCDLA